MPESLNLSKGEEDILFTSINHTSKSKLSLTYNILHYTDNCLKRHFLNSNSHKNRDQNN